MKQWRGPLLAAICLWGPLHAADQPHQIASKLLAEEGGIEALQQLFQAGMSPAQAPDLYHDSAWKPSVPHWTMARHPTPESEDLDPLSESAINENTRMVNRLARELFAVAQMGNEWACRLFAEDHFEGPRSTWYQKATSQGFISARNSKETVDSLRAICGDHLRATSYSFNLNVAESLTEVAARLQGICGVAATSVKESFVVSAASDEHSEYPEYLVFLSQAAQSDGHAAVQAKMELAMISSGAPLNLSASNMPLLFIYGLDQQCEKFDVSIN